MLRHVLRDLTGPPSGRTFWATTYVYRVRFQRVDRYRSAEKSARSANRGVHRTCAGDFHRN